MTSNPLKKRSFRLVPTGQTVHNVNGWSMQVASVRSMRGGSKLALSFEPQSINKFSDLNDDYHDIGIFLPLDFFIKRPHLVL